MMKALSNLDLSQRSSFNLVRRSCWTAWSVSLYTRESQWLYNIMVQRKGATSGARSRIPDTRFHKQKWHANNLVGFSDVIIVFICHKLSHSKCLVKLMMRVSWRKPCMQLVQWRIWVTIRFMGITIPIMLTAKDSTTLWDTWKTSRKLFMTYTMLGLINSVHTSQQRWIEKICSVRQGFSLNPGELEQAFACMNA